MILLILASGSGKRLKNKTKNKPKCLVKVNDKPILSYMEKFINYFDKTLIVVGHKSSEIKEYLKGRKIKFINNKKYKNTNMVESIFCAKKFINDDLVVVYSDIIFDKSIINILRTKKTTLPLKKNWYNVWKQRMKKSEIKNDAENIKIKNNFLINIGGKIENKFPKYQFMGILKIIKKDFFKMKNYYYKLNNKNIDLTKFLNQYLQKSKNKIHCRSTNKFWFEIDSLRDLKVANRLIKHKNIW